MQELNGYIKLYRKLIQWGWCQDNIVKSLFLHCLLMASFKEFDWMGQKMNPGQFITSRKNLAKDLGFSEMQIRTALKKLESTKEITIETTNKYTVITVMNWDNYQSDNDFNNQDFNQQITNKQPTDLMNKLLTVVETLEKSTNKTTSKNEIESLLNSGISELKSILATKTLTNKQPTDNQQITNKQPHRKNVKNVKNVKNNSSDGASAAPQLPEILLFISENRLRVDGREFYKRYSENGWKTESGKRITDWKRMLKVWDKRERENKPTYANGYSGVKNLADD